MTVDHGKLQRLVDIDQFTTVRTLVVGVLQIRDTKGYETATQPQAKENHSTTRQPRYHANFRSRTRHHVLLAVLANDIGWVPRIDFYGLAGHHNHTRCRSNHTDTRRWRGRPTETSVLSSVAVLRRRNTLHFCVGGARVCRRRRRWRSSSHIKNMFLCWTELVLCKLKTQDINQWYDVNFTEEITCH